MLICNVSPAVAVAEETQITLEFARGAKELKNRVCTALLTRQLTGTLRELTQISGTFRAP